MFLLFIIVHTQYAEQAIHHNENEKKSNTNLKQTLHIESCPFIYSVITSISRGWGYFSS